MRDVLVKRRKGETVNLFSNLLVEDKSAEGLKEVSSLNSIIAAWFV